MVNYLSAALDNTFAALADPTRRAILAQLAQGEAQVTQLASRFDISLPGVVKHLRVLEAAKLLATEKTGRVRRCRLSPEPLKNAAEWIAFYRRFWEHQLDNLARYFNELNNEEKRRWEQRKRKTSLSSTSRGRSPRRSRKFSKPLPDRKS